MVLLEIERPLAMKIAISKGLMDPCNYEELKFDRGREIGNAVLLDGFEYTLYKHLIIQKEGKNIIDSKDIDNHISYYLERGASIIKKEMEQLAQVENYLLTLIEQPLKTRIEERKSKTDDELVFELLGI